MIIIGNDLQACEFRIDLAIEQKYFKHIVKQIQIALFKQTSGLVVRVLFRLKTNQNVSLRLYPKLHVSFRFLKLGLYILTLMFERTRYSKCVYNFKVLYIIYHQNKSNTKVKIRSS